MRIEDGNTVLHFGSNGSESPSSAFNGKLRYLFLGRDVGKLEWNNYFDLDCSELKELLIGSNVTVLSGFGGSQITQLIIPQNVIFINDAAFTQCTKLEYVVFEDGENEIRCRRSYYKPNQNGGLYNWGAFSDSPLKECYIGRPINLTSDNSNALAGPFNDSMVETVTISESLTSLCDIYRCTNLASIDISSSISELKGFVGCSSLITVKCRATNPPALSKYLSNICDNSTYLNGTLFVPETSIDLYKENDIWGKFFDIRGLSGTSDERQKCESPVISYSNGKLTFNCSTEGATCQSTITDTDISSYSSNEVQLGVTYNISVYATKAGYENSDVVTATLCWIDVEPKTEGVENSIAQVRANAVLIQTGDGRITINGANDGTVIGVYNTNGILSGTEISRNGSAVVSTNLQAGSVAIVKIGEMSVKVIVK